MAFAVNHNEAYQGYEMVDQGRYEGIIINPKFDTTRGGTEYINVPVVIRNDVNQKFHKIVETQGAQCSGYCLRRILEQSNTDAQQGGEIAGRAVIQYH